jgi:hypothetical protein
MKKALLILTSVVIILSCGEKSKTDQQPSARESKILAVYTLPDSSKVVEVLLRIITKTVKYDSVKKEDAIVVDTLWGIPRHLPITDSTGKVVMKDGKPMINPVAQYFKISNDSVNWHVENIHYDSLIKKNK